MRRVLFVMRPEADDFYDFFFLEDLVNEAVLDVDSAGIGAFEISDELLKGRGILKGIFLKNLKQRFSLRP